MDNEDEQRKEHYKTSGTIIQEENRRGFFGDENNYVGFIGVSILC